MKNKYFRKTLVYVTTFTLLFAVFATMPFNVAADYQPAEPPIVEDPPLEEEHGWLTEGDGTYFEIVNSSYLNISLISSEDVHILLESVPNVVSFCINSNSMADSTLITLSGFEVDKTYYLHEDGYQINTFTTDGSGLYSYTQDISTPHHVFIQEYASTIYIQSDGSIDPPTAPISRVGDVYTLTDNISDAGGIRIYRSDVTLDGNGHTLQGSGGAYNVYGIYINQRDNIVIKNLYIDNYGSAIALYWCDNIDIINSTITGNSWSGTRHVYASNVTVIGSTISNNDAHYGLYHYGGSDITIEGNTISNHTSNAIYTHSSSTHGYTNNIIIINNVFLDNKNGIMLTYVGSGVIVRNNTISNLPGGYSTGCYCLYGSDFTIADNTVFDCPSGIGLAGCSDIIIIGNTVLNATSSGIHLFSYCSAITIMSNTVSNTNAGKCILLSDCSDFIVNSNTVSNGFNGIYLCYGSSFTVTHNTVSNCTDAGIWLRGSSDSTVAFNTVSDNIHGIAFWYYCSGLTIEGNTISDNLLGIYLRLSNSNTFYHNNIIDNTYQIQISSSSNIWDNGAGEGNYWSDYSGLDDGSDGRIENDGVGDTNIPHPYTNQGYGYYQLDNYPLMNQWIYVNYPPVADAGGPYINQHEGESYTLDASGSTDPNYDLLTYRWDLDNDGTWDTGYSTDPTYTFTKNDDYSGVVKVEVFDGELTATGTADVIFINRNPFIEESLLESYIADEGSMITFGIMVSDAGTDDLTFTWDWDDGTTDIITYESLGTPPFYYKQMSHKYGDNDIYTVTLTVEDDDGGTITVTTTVTVNNVDPFAMILGGIGIADNYIFTANWYGHSWIMDILSDGSFETPELIDDKSSGTYGAGIGDFDNDGDLDALLGDAYNTWYYEKLGAGNDFASAVSIDSTHLGYRMDFAEADYNNDGNLDAIMACYGRNYYSVYMGNGDGSFSFSTLNGPTGIIGMDSGDFNGDSNMDFIAAGWGTSGAYVYMGNGDGTFQPPIILSIGTSWGVCAGDFNNDGDDDFIFGTYSTMLYPGNGDGTFGSGISLGVSSYALAESDINNDGNLDLVYTDYNNIYYMTGNGDGTFNYESTTWINYDMYSIAVSPESGGGGLEADEGELIEFEGTFSDLGWLDTHTATWNWGDGSPTEAGTVTEENVEPMATGEIYGEYTYSDNDEYTVTLTVTDDNGGYGSDTITVIIKNVPPTADAGNDQIAFVGLPASFSGSFTDPGWLDTHTIEWDWNDGSPFDYGTLTPTHTYTDMGTYTVTLTVTDDDGGAGTDTITVTVYMPPVADAGSDQTVDEGDTVNFDASLSTGSYIEGATYDWIDAATLGVRDDTLSTHNDTYVLWDLGFTFNFYGNDYSQVYICTNGYLTFESGYWTWDNNGATLPSTLVPPNMIAPAFYDMCPYYGGDIYIYQDLTSSPKKFVVEWHECEMYGTPGNNTLEVILYETGVIKYQYGYSTSNWDPDWVGNYPLAGIQNQDRTVGIEYKDYIDQSLYDGLAIEFYSDSNSYADLVMNTVYYSINSYAWDFDNDGTYDYQETTSDAPDGVFDGKTTHIYGDNNAYTVTVQVTDDLGATDTDTCLVTVNNVAPTITTLTAPIDPVQLGNSITVNGEFTDPGFLDTHTASIDWGDTIVDDLGTVTSPIPNQTHTYASPGVYTITLTVTDDDGDNDTMFFKYVVIYDPTDGFVTGGGWINSPVGAYTPNPNLTGKANFGFVAKYKKGQSTPDGNTEFNFKVANMNFHSNNYEWLVIIIAGAKAIYKGTGTINGEGNYGFQLSAIDEDLTPSTDVDLFRIKIWDKDNNDEIVYDNQLGEEDDSDPTTQISGGSIKIHKN